MRRRLALARLVLRPPRLLLLDEPYAAFDVDGIRRVNDFVRQVTATGGAAIISTHDLPRALPVADRVVHIVDGQLYDGAPSDLDFRLERAEGDDADELHSAAGGVR
jgi:energy-coupling factor transporter ATP-binding protein EcfA2